MAGLRTVISFHSAYVTARGPLTDVYGGGAAVARQVGLRQALLPRGTVTMELGSSAARVPPGRIRRRQINWRFYLPPRIGRSGPVRPGRDFALVFGGPAGRLAGGRCGGAAPFGTQRLPRFSYSRRRASKATRCARPSSPGSL